MSNKKDDRDERVLVHVRVRPLTHQEDGQSVIVSSNEKKKLTICKDRGAGVRSFGYDRVYWSLDGSDTFDTQQDIYNDIGVLMLDHAFTGYNTCIFAYGQTGSGKTYTMMGDHKSSEDTDTGIIPRACNELFNKIDSGFTLVHSRSESPDDNMPVCINSYEVLCSYYEIYNEKVYDLLEPGKEDLRVREHPTLGPYVENLTLKQVSFYDDVESLLLLGNRHRHTNSTKLNERSSRSHAIFTVVLKQSHFSEGELSEFVSRINLVDLAGSERTKNAGTKGETLNEGININKSLCTLGQVIHNLAESHERHKDMFINFRDSNLTWLLRENLGGNSKTIMVATISPAANCYDESLNTLRYADRVKHIRQKAIINEDSKTKLIRDLRQEVAHLRRENMEIAKLRHELVLCKKAAALSSPTALLERTNSAMTLTPGDSPYLIILRPNPGVTTPLLCRLRAAGVLLTEPGDNTTTPASVLSKQYPSLGVAADAVSVVAMPGVVKHAAIFLKTSDKQSVYGNRPCRLVPLSAQCKMGNGSYTSTPIPLHHGCIVSIGDVVCRFADPSAVDAVDDPLVTCTTVTRGDSSIQTADKDKETLEMEDQIIRMMSPEQQNQYNSLTAMQQQVFLSRHLEGMKPLAKDVVGKDQPLKTSLSVDEQQQSLLLTPTQLQQYSNLNVNHKQQYALLTAEQQLKFLDSLPLPEKYDKMGISEIQGLNTQQSELLTTMLKELSPTQQQQLEVLTASQQQVYMNLTPRDKDVFGSLTPKQQQAFIELTPRQQHRFLSLTPRQQQQFMAEQQLQLTPQALTDQQRLLLSDVQPTHQGHVDPSLFGTGHTTVMPRLNMTALSSLNASGLQQSPSTDTSVGPHSIETGRADVMGFMGLADKAKFILSKLADESEDKAPEVAELHRLTAQMEEAMITMHREQIEAKREQETSVKEIDELKVQASDHQQLLGQVKEESTKELMLKELKVEEAHKEVDAKNTVLNEVSADFYKQKEEYEERLQEMSHTATRRMEEAVSEQNRRLAQSEECIHVLEVQFQDAEERYHLAMDEKDMELIDIQAKLNATECVLNEERRDNETLRLDQATLEQQYEETTQSLESVKEAFNSVLSEVSQLKNELVVERETMVESTAQMQVLEAEVGKLQMLEEEAKKKMTALTTQHDVKLKEIESKAVEIHELRRNEKKLAKRLEEESQLSREQLLLKEKEVRHLRELTDQKEIARTAVETQCDLLRSRVEGTLEELQRLQTEIVDCEFHLRDKEDKIKELHGEKQKLVQAHAQETESQRSVRETSMAEQQGQIRDLNEQIYIIQTKAREVQEKNRDLYTSQEKIRERRVKLKLELDQKEFELKDTKQKYLEAHVRLQQAIKKGQKEQKQLEQLRRLTTLVKEQEARIEYLQKELKESQAQNKRLEEVHISALSPEQLQQVKEDMQSVLRALKAEVIHFSPPALRQIQTIVNSVQHAVDPRRIFRQV